MCVFFCILLLFHLLDTITSNDYYVATPSTFRLDAQETIGVVFDGVKDVVARIFIQDYPVKKKILVERYLLIEPGLPKIFRFKLNAADFPEKFLNQPGTPKLVCINVEIEDFRKEVLVSIITESGYAFIQTDKPIYSRGQEVHFRIIPLTEETTLSSKDFKLQIKNPNGIVVEETTFKRHRQSSPTFENHVYRFPKYPIMGQWSATVLYGYQMQQYSSVSFDLKDYVLPTFLVRLKVPEVILPSSEEIRLEVEAKYVYGKKLNGGVIFNVGLKKGVTEATEFFAVVGPRKLVNGSYVISLKTLALKEDEDVGWFPKLEDSFLVVEAVVIDEATGRKVRVTDSKGIFTGSAFTISFKRCLKDFKPDLVTVFEADINYINGRPASGIRVRILVKADGEPMIIEQDTALSDENGKVSFEILPGAQHEALTFTLETIDERFAGSQASGSFEQFRYRSDSNAFIAIDRKSTHKLRPGDNFVKLIHSEPPNMQDLYYMVVSKGKIFKFEKIPERNEVQFQVTFNMVPRFRIIAFTHYNGELLADSLNIEVETVCYGDAKVTLSADFVVKEPGKTGKFSIKGSKGNLVGLLAVDEALYALSKTDLLTKDKVFNEMSSHDLGCGPGGGITTSSVLNNAGIALITNHFTPLLSNACGETKRIKREALLMKDNSGFPGRVGLPGIPGEKYESAFPDFSPHGEPGPKCYTEDSGNLEIQAPPGRKREKRQAGNVTVPREQIIKILKAGFGELGPKEFDELRELLELYGITEEQMVGMDRPGSPGEPGFSDGTTSEGTVDGRGEGIEEGSGGGIGGGMGGSGGGVGGRSGGGTGSGELWNERFLDLAGKPGLPGHPGLSEDNGFERLSEQKDEQSRFNENGKPGLPAGPPLPDELKGVVKKPGLSFRPKPGLTGLQEPEGFLKADYQDQSGLAGLKGEMGDMGIPEATTIYSERDEGYLNKVKRSLRNVSEEEVQIIEQNLAVRSDFMETWIFEDVQIEESDREIPARLPSSMTTWVVQAVSVSFEHGLCISEPQRIESMKKVFLHLDIPNSAVINKLAEIDVTIFNYEKNTLQAYVYMHDASELCTEALPGLKTQRQTLIIKPNSGQCTSIPVIPLTLPNFDIRVMVATSEGSDAVQKQLLVVSESVTKEINISIILDPSNQLKREKKVITTDQYSDFIDTSQNSQLTHVKVSVPPEFIPETASCTIEAMGQSIGSAVQAIVRNAETLLEKPRGSGEQNIMYLASTVYIMRYLKITDRLTKANEEKGYEFIRLGYSNQLSFRQEDGSYSDYENLPSSAWLTAFVMKVFCQANNYVHISSSVVCSGLKWILRYQRPDGSFTEVFRMIELDMMGGVQTDTSMTAFVSIVLEECFCKDDIVSAAKKRALSYLEDHLAEVNSSVEIAMVAYALSLGGSEQKTVANDRLLSVAVEDKAQNMLHWEKENHFLTIEAAGYALLNQLHLDNMEKAAAIVNWLNTKILQSGSFESTQDTVIALQALSEYSIRTRMQTINLVSNILSSTDPSFHKVFVINEGNAHILQELMVDKTNDTFLISTMGKGVGRLNVRLRYSVIKPDQKCKFDIKVNLPDLRDWRIENDDIRNISLEVRNSGIEDSEMAVVDVEIFPGYVPKMEDLGKLVYDPATLVETYEISSRGVVFYMRTIPAEKSYSFHFHIIKKYDAEKVFSHSVNVYDYYNPDVSCTVFYNPGGDSNVLQSRSDTDSGRYQCHYGGCPPKWWDVYAKAAGTGGNKGIKKLSSWICQRSEYVWIGEYKSLVNLGNGLSNLTFSIKDVVREGLEKRADVEGHHRSFLMRYCTGIFYVQAKSESFLILGKDKPQYANDQSHIGYRYLLDENSILYWLNVQQKRYNDMIMEACKLIKETGCPS